MTWDREEGHRRIGKAMALEAMRRLKQGYDPCDDWPVFVWNGKLCQLGQFSTFDFSCTEADVITSWSWSPAWL